MVRDKSSKIEIKINNIECRFYNNNKYNENAPESTVLFCSVLFFSVQSLLPLLPPLSVLLYSTSTGLGRGARARARARESRKERQRVLYMVGTGNLLTLAVTQYVTV